MFYLKRKFNKTQTKANKENNEKIKKSSTAYQTVIVLNCQLMQEVNREWLTRSTNSRSILTINMLRKIKNNNNKLFKPHDIKRNKNGF